MPPCETHEDFPNSLKKGGAQGQISPQAEGGAGPWELQPNGEKSLFVTSSFLPEHREGGTDPGQLYRGHLAKPHRVTKINRPLPTHQAPAPVPVPRFQPGAVALGVQCRTR